MCTPDIPGTTIYDSKAGPAKATPSTRCGLFVQPRPTTARAYVRNEDAYCESLRIEPRSSATPCAPAMCCRLIEAGGNTYYLSKFAGIFGLERAGHRRPADRPDEGRVPGPRSWPPPDPPRDAMATIVGAITTSHVPAIGRAIAHKACSRSPTGSPFFDAFAPVHQPAGRDQPEVLVVLLQRPRPQLLPRQDADLRGRCRDQYYSGADEGWGLPVSKASFEGEQTLSWNTDRRSWSQDEFDITMLPGDAGRPRLRGADGAAVAGQGLAR